MVIEMKLNKEPFDAIALGRKTIELRLYDEKRRKLNIGDEIIFTNLKDRSERLAVRIKALFRYETFEELFSEISLEKCGFNGASPAEAAADMREYYSDKKIRQYGVLGIRMELVSLDETLKKQEKIREAEFERLFPDGMK